MRARGLARLTAMLLILSLLAAGCSGAGNGGTGSGDAGTQNAAAADGNRDSAASDSGGEDGKNGAGTGSQAGGETEDLAAANADAAAQAEALSDSSEWITFLLICNEGMNNTGSNVGNTLMAVGMHPETGKIRLMMFTWDTFVKYEGYDIPQLIDMAYRNNGPEEAVKVFDDNFDMHIDRFMSLNFLNLSSLIDTYGGVEVDVSRAERNALNSLVASKRRDLQSKAGNNMLTQYALDMLEQDYHLSDFGPDTKLNGLQAVSYGWLQYDSVYNCCHREIEVVAALFEHVAEDINDLAVFYTNETDPPDPEDIRKPINLDEVTEEDRAFLLQSLSPITNMSYNNLSEEEFSDMALAFARAAYAAARQGVDIFDNLEQEIFPLEATEPYTIVAGTEGHVIDYDANSTAMKEFLYKAEN